MKLGWSKFQTQIEGVHYQPGGGAINMIHTDGSKGYDKEAFEEASRPKLLGEHDPTQP